MDKLLRRLMLGGAAVSLVGSTSFITGAAWAQGNATAGNAAPQIEEVIVTGTSIRGTAPIGSNVITVDQGTIQDTGAVNMEELLQTVTAVSTAGAAPQGESAYSYYAPQIHDLAGSASNSTLVIVNGLRLPSGGEQGYVESDPNIIPTIAIERVEVLADGASSIYGSDAVAGVVNFITRKNYDGLLIQAQAGIGDDYSNNTEGVLWGTHWDNGSVMAAGNYDYQSRLPFSSRSFESLGNYTPLGGNKFDETFGCPVAAVSVPGSANLYLTPQSTTTVTNTIANSNCNTTIYGDDLPRSVRENALVQINQDFGDRFTTSWMLNVNVLKTDRNQGPGSVSNATVYGPGSGKGGQINPFFQAPAGAPTATQESVTWVDLMGNGPTGTNYGSNTTEEDTFYSQFVATYKFPGTWEAKFSDSLGYMINQTASVNDFCAACAYLALNGTAQTSASLTASDISAENVISTNLPLTTSNALDVWNPAGSNLTSATVLQNLYRGELHATDLDTHNQMRLEGDGALFDLPAGPLKLALGAEMALYHLTQETAALNGTGLEFLGQQALFFRYNRVVYSGYGEFNIPVISPEMSIPFVKKVDVDISGRYDRYSDVGPTANPKFAANWQVVDGLLVRANYSTSFVAPPMGVIGTPAFGGQYASGASVTNGGLVVPVQNYPNVTQLPGCSGATVTCTLPSSDQGLARQFGCALEACKPETGNGWVVGTDITPTILPGFQSNISLFYNEFKGGITNGNFALTTTTPGLENRFVVYPGCATQAQINAFTRVPEGGVFNGTIPSCVEFVWNHDETNLLYLRVKGIDASVSYDFDTDWGHFKIGDSITEFLQFDQNSAGGTWFSIMNTVGLNITFPSVQQVQRANLGWSMGPYSANMYVNYTGGYRYVGSTAINPVLDNGPNGTFSGGGDAVKSNTTIDLHIAYDFADGWLEGDQVYFDGKNIFDKSPPFINGNTSGIGIGANGYDGFVSNPLGRILSLGLRAKF